MGECDRDQSAHVDLLDAAASGAGVQGVGFDEPESVGDCGLVCAFDVCRHGRFGQCPECRDALHRREGEVEAGHRCGLLA